jgi:DNA-binding beta-propeller fold protein YncE
MRFLKIVLCASFTVGSLQAQSLTLNGPTLGFTAEDNGTAIRPILGIPGASILADRLQLASGIRGAVISPKHDYALATRADDEQILIIDLSSGSLAMNAIPGTHAGAGLIAVSPSGTFAAVFDEKTRSIQIVGNLPQSPERIFEFDASRIPGRASSIAVDDDGSIALVRFVDGESVSLWALDWFGASWPIQVDRPSAAAFKPRSFDFFVAEDAGHSVFLIRDPQHTAERIPVFSSEDGSNGASAIAASDDGGRLFVADAKSGRIAMVDLATGNHVDTSCDCQPTGFYRLKGNSVFALSEATQQPTMVLDASGADLRIGIIPPAVLRAEGAQ